MQQVIRKRFFLIVSKVMIGVKRVKQMKIQRKVERRNQFFSTAINENEDDDDDQQRELDNEDDYDNKDGNEEEEEDEDRQPMIKKHVLLDVIRASYL